MDAASTILEDLFNQWSSDLKPQAISYRGWIIEPINEAPFKFKYYNEKEGIDGSYENGRWFSNVSYADSIEEAKDEIFERVMTAVPYHKVELNGRLYDFPWIEDAVGFANMFGGNLFPICNP